MKIVGIHGFKRCGKDTMRKYIQEHTDYSPSYSFASPIYAMIELLVGNPLPKDKHGDFDKEAVIEPFGVTLRHMLQTLGTEWGRDHIHEDIWVLKAEEWLESLNCTHKGKEPDYVIFSDVRFQNEVEFIHANGGKIYKVVGAESLDALDLHPSESGLPYKYIDMTVYNTGTLEVFYDNIARTVGYSL